MKKTPNFTVRGVWAKGNKYRIEGNHMAQRLSNVTMVDVKAQAALAKHGSDCREKADILCE